MNMKKGVVLAVYVLSLAVYNYGQNQDWSKLKLLESSREEVEQILGKPNTYFENYGIYKAKNGRFSVWYSEGKCSKDTKVLQWNVPAQKITGLLFYPNQRFPLKHYISNAVDYKKQNSPDNLSRFYYTSPNEDVIYGTIIKKDGSEFVYTIEIQPGKSDNHLICKSENF